MHLQRSAALKITSKANLTKTTTTTAIQHNEASSLYGCIDRVYLIDTKCIETKCIAAASREFFPSSLLFLSAFAAPLQLVVIDCTLEDGCCCCCCWFYIRKMLQQFPTLLKAVVIVVIIIVFFCCCYRSCIRILFGFVCCGKTAAAATCTPTTTITTTTLWQYARLHGNQCVRSINNMLLLCFCCYFFFSFSVVCFITNSNHILLVF